MKHIQKIQQFINSNNLTNSLFREDCIFFDIETTGFSAKTSSIYLIGCSYKKGSNIIIEQFFAESPTDEKEILLHFIELLNNYKTIFSFNGLGFDLPFIKAKCNAYKIFEMPDPIQYIEDSIPTFDFFNKFQYIDIFKEVNNIKCLLKLPNYKQKTIEQFLDIKRDDKYTGGELIRVYEEYVKTHDANAEELLLLHNYQKIRVGQNHQNQAKKQSKLTYQYNFHVS